MTEETESIFIFHKHQNTTNRQTVKPELETLLKILIWGASKNKGNHDNRI
jgi:hypothetical protein